jgi:hypothetical protein
MKCTPEDEHRLRIVPVRPRVSCILSHLMLVFQITTWKFPCHLHRTGGPAVDAFLEVREIVLGVSILRMYLKLCMLVGFPAVDGFHVQGMTEHKGEPFPAAQIRYLVPSEHTLHYHHEIFSIGGDGFQEQIGICAVVPVQDILPDWSTMQIYIDLACRSMQQ